MDSPRKKSASGSAKRKRKRKAPDPTPYHQWPENAEAYHFLVSQKVGENLPTWTCRTGQTPISITLDDLAVGLWAVECTSGKGTSYGQIRCCFKVCLDKGCHDAKATAILTKLLAAGLIQKVGNYSSGRHGNVYELVRSGQQAQPFQPKPKPAPAVPPSLPSADDNADPFSGGSEGIGEKTLLDDLLSVPKDGSNFPDE